jgi:hypothetical protein
MSSSGRANHPLIVIAILARLLEPRPFPRDSALDGAMHNLQKPDAGFPTGFGQREVARPGGDSTVAFC